VADLQADDHDDPASELFRKFVRRFGIDEQSCDRCARSRLPAPFNLESYSYTARNGPTWTWDVEFARGLIRERVPTSHPVRLATSELLVRLDGHAQLDAEHIQHIPPACLEEPVLVAPAPDGRGQVLIDGCHRASALIRANRDVTAYLVSETESAMAIAVVPQTIRRVYQALVELGVVPDDRER
jgi:hypothetical protein